jgi:hypothetical protein
MQAQKLSYLNFQVPFESHYEIFGVGFGLQARSAEFIP